jgi:two-component system, cell cycle sensor histidine kinase and response regulator CckA
MGMVAGSPSYALADLAQALTGAATGLGAVLDTAVRAAAEMLGDGAGVQLMRDDGTYAPIVMHHPDPARARLLATALDRAGQQPDDPYSTTLRATRRPVVLSELASGVTACVLCPLVVDKSYRGYLALARTEKGGAYPPAEVDLARDIAGELSLALASAYSMQRLRASEERYRRVLETIPEGVFQLDGDGYTTFANDPIAALLGMPRDHLVGLPMRAFLDNRGKAELPGWLAESRAGHATLGETRLVRANGTHCYVRLSMVPLPDEDGQSGGSLCMVTDITEHVEARGLKRQLDHLRRLDSLGQLIGGIAHDFNNLLTVVAGSADIIAAGAEPGSTHHELATGIVHATGKGRTLARQLLAFGRGGGSRPEIISVPDLLADVQPMFSRTLGEHIRLEFSVAADVWPVRAERGPLEQALVNVAANARDAMLHGGALTVAATNAVIEAGQLDDPGLSGRFVRLVVADTGNGMDDETRRQACEPFFTTRSAAAGLGLSTAVSIVRAAGGSLCLESAPRIGTTVQLYLPAVDAPVDASGAGGSGGSTGWAVVGGAAGSGAAGAAGAAGTAGAAGAAGRAAGDAAATATNPGGLILVVEDQPELAQLIRRLLEPAGYAVTVGSDARDAIMKVASGMSPDLLVTDVVMPGMTGPELAAALRQRQPDLPVLYMSGYTAAALGPEAKLDSRSAMVEKPFNRDMLLTAVRRLRQ